MTAIVNLGANVPLTTGSGTSTRRSPNLDAQLNTCRAQLADWVTCDSAKTPEGKAKIAQISAKVDALKQQIASADKAQAQGPRARTDAAAAAQPADASRPRADPTSFLGSRLDLYA